MARRIENGKKIRRRREEKNREENTERAVVSHRWYWLALTNTQVCCPVVCLFLMTQGSITAQAAYLWAESLNPTWGPFPDLISPAHSLTVNPHCPMSPKIYFNRWIYSIYTVWVRRAFCQSDFLWHSLWWSWRSLQPKMLCSLTSSSGRTWRKFLNNAVCAALSTPLLRLWRTHQRNCSFIKCSCLTLTEVYSYSAVSFGIIFMFSLTHTVKQRSDQHVSFSLVIQDMHNAILWLYTLLQFCLKHLHKYTKLYTMTFLTLHCLKGFVASCPVSDLHSSA